MNFTKSLKKVLCLTTVICLLMTICPTLSFASDSLVPKTGLMFKLDFNYGTDTVLPENGYLTRDGAVTDQRGIWIGKARDAESASGLTVLAANKYLKGADWFQIVEEWPHDSELTYGRYFTEFKVKFDNLSKINTLFKAYTVVNGSNSVGPNLAVTENGGRYILTAGTSWTTFAFNTNTWYNIKLDINTPENKFDVYVDGAPVANNIAFSGGGANPGYNKVIFEHSNYAGGSNNNDIYLDDIKIYRQPTGVITYAADDFSTYASDVTYNGSYSSFAGLVGGTVNNVGIDAANDRAYFTVANAASEINWEINKNAQEYKQKSFVLEFELNPTNVDRRPNLSIKNKTGEHTLLQLSVYKESIAVTHASETIGVASAATGLTQTFAQNGNYKFKFVIDFNRTYTQTSEDGLTTQQRPGVCDVYLNDELVVSNVGLCYGDGYSEGEGTGLQLSISHGDWKPTYLDNFRLYSDEREEVISRLNAEMAAQCANGVVSTDTINLPATYTVPSGNTYKIDWTSSNNIAINPSTGAVNLDKCAAGVALTAKVYYEGEEDLGITRTYNLRSNRFSLDFDYDENTTLASGGYLTYSGEVTTQRGIWIGKGDGANVLAANKYLEGATWFRIHEEWPATLTNNRYLTEFKFKMDELANVSNLFRACALNADTSYNQSKGVTMGTVGKEDGTYVITAGETWTSFTLAAGEWYNVKADIDTANKKFDLYINGINIANDIAFSGSTYEHNSDFNNVLFEHINNSGKAVCLDDIRIYKEVKDDAYVIDGCTIAGYKLTSVSVIKNTTVEADLYAAVYNGSGKLTDCAIINNVATGDHSLDVDVPAGSKIMIFVWSNDNTLTPLRQPYPAQ